MQLKELKSLLKVLRDNGVTAYEHDGVKLSLSDLPVGKEAVTAAIPDDYKEPTDEDLLFYSAIPPKTED